MKKHYNTLRRWEKKVEGQSQTKRKKKKGNFTDPVKGRKKRGPPTRRDIRVLHSDKGRKKLREAVDGESAYEIGCLNQS